MLEECAKYSTDSRIVDLYLEMKDFWLFAYLQFVCLQPFEGLNKMRNYKSTFVFIFHILSRGSIVSIIHKIIFFIEGFFIKN